MMLPWEDNTDYIDSLGSDLEYGPEDFEYKGSDFDTISYNVNLVHQTEKAYLLHLIGVGDFWVPKELCVLKGNQADVYEGFKFKIIKPKSIDKVEGVEITF